MIWHIPKPPGSGIGQALAEECVRRGCHVVLVDFDKDAVESVERDLAMETSKAQSVVSRVVDVTDVESIEALHAPALLSQPYHHRMLVATAVSSIFCAAKLAISLLHLVCYHADRR